LDAPQLVLWALVTALALAILALVCWALIAILGWLEQLWHRGPDS